MQNREKGNFVFHFLQSECEIFQYNIESRTSRKTGPATFHNFYKYTGICMLADGRLMFAGGLKEETREGTTSCWVLDPHSRHNENLAELKYKQYGVRLVLINREVYAIAGIEIIPPESSRSRCQKFLLDSNQWVDIAPVPSCTFQPGVCHLAGRIFSVGGYVEDSGNVNLYIVQAYTIQTDT